MNSDEEVREEAEVKVVEQEEQTFTPIVITIESEMEREIMDTFFRYGSEIMREHRENPNEEVTATQFEMFQRWFHRNDDC